MTRKENALLEIAKRGGTLNEREIACRVLLSLTGKDYSHLLPKKESLLIKNEIVVNQTFEKFIEEIKNNLPFWYDAFSDLWVGSKKMKISSLEAAENPAILVFLKTFCKQNDKQN